MTHTQVTHTQAERTADEILGLLQAAADQDYIGEQVSQLEHALQAAHLAENHGADPELVLAALLHDIGHVVEESAAQLGAGFGAEDHEGLGAAYLRQRGCSARLCALVQGHVAAKRYLAGKHPRYLDQLSPASLETLALQGGPMSGPEIVAFEQTPLWREKILLRTWDEQAKVPDVEVPGLDDYRPRLVAHLVR